MPSLYVFPADSPYGGRRGALGSVLVAFGGRGGRLRAEAEVGYGGRAVGAAAISYQGTAVQGRLAARHQPEGTASLGLGRPHGTFLEGDGTARVTERLSAATSFSVDRNESATLAHRSDAASAELRFQPVHGVRLRAGVRFGSFAPGGSAPAARTLTLPIEAAWDGARGGAYAVYRLQRRSVSSEIRSGGRVGASLRHSGLQASVYLDWQPSAVSLDSVLGAQPGVARALAELGLSAQTPDELARLLRENAALVELGYFDPASLRFDAVRRQAGLDLTWSPAPRQRLSARLLLDRTRSADMSRTTSLATLAYSREMAGIEVLASVSLYARGGSGSENQPSFRIGLRRGFDRVPWHGRSALAGTVFRDDEATGRPGSSPRGVSGAEVRLADGRFTRTDERGRFRFDGVARGARRVELALPAGAYFTTPSAIEVSGRGEAAFGVAFTPARLYGVVSDDSGLGVAGVRLRLWAGAVNVAATTDSRGAFSFAVAEGEYDLAIEPASLPPGYARPAGHRETVRLRRDAPARADVEIVAQHSVGGRVATSRPQETQVCLREERRCTTPAPDGRYVFRGVKAGDHTIVATYGAGMAARTVLVPPQPGPVSGVDLELP
jgi:hypothetical protein